MGFSESRTSALQAAQGENIMASSQYAVSVNDYGSSSLSRPRTSPARQGSTSHYQGVSREGRGRVSAKYMDVSLWERPARSASRRWLPRNPESDRSKQEVIVKNQVMTPAGGWPWPDERGRDASPVQNLNDGFEGRRAHDRASTAPQGLRRGKSDERHYSGHVRMSSKELLKEINALRHDVESKTKLTVPTKEECFLFLHKASNFAGNRNLQKLLLEIYESFRKMTASDTFESQKDQAAMERKYKQMKAKNKLSIKQLENQTEEQLRNDMENYKRDITRQVETSIETTLEIERNHIMELNETKCYEQSATFASSCLNQHFPTMERSWRDFFLVAIDKANDALEEKYIVDRNAKLLAESMESMYFSERKQSAEIVKLLNKSLDFQHSPGGRMVDLQRKYCLLLPGLIVKEEQVRLADKIMEYKELLADFKSKEAMMNRMKAEIDVLTADKRKTAMEKNALENDLKQVNSQLETFEKSIGVWHESHQNSYSAKSLCNRLEDVMGLFERSRKSNLSKDPSDLSKNAVPGPGHDQGWRRFLGIMKELDLMSHLSTFLNEGLRTQFGLMNVSIKALQNVNLTAIEIERVRTWQVEQQGKTQGHLLPISFQDRISTEDYKVFLAEELKRLE